MWVSHFINRANSTPDLIKMASCRMVSLIIRYYTFGSLKRVFAEPDQKFLFSLYFLNHELSPDGSFFKVDCLPRPNRLAALHEIRSPSLNSLARRSQARRHEWRILELLKLCHSCWNVSAVWSNNFISVRGKGGPISEWMPANRRIPVFEDNLGRKLDDTKSGLGVIIDF